jgi:hypothetical protein
VVRGGRLDPARREPSSRPKSWVVVMGTVYGETVDVRLQSEELQPNPSTFRWRGHTYVVASVLSHWRERSAWWASAAAHAVHGDRVDLEGRRGSEPGDTSRPGALADPGGSRPTPHPALLGEREVWRVEARRIARSGLGIYDLCRDREHDETAVTDRWFLLRVAD